MQLNQTKFDHLNQYLIYITHYPCIICTRLLLAADVKEIKYFEDYKNDEFHHLIWFQNLNLNLIYYQKLFL